MGKTPAITVPQAKRILARLLRDRPPSPDEIARVAARALRRNEESSILPLAQGHRGLPPAVPEAEYE